MNRYEINELYKDFFMDFLVNIRDIFTKNDTLIHKARNELKIVQHSKYTTVVKSFKVPNIINKIVYTFFRDSKAKKSYTHSLKLKEFTPMPIAYIEFFKFGLLNESYFVSENFNYDFTIREPLLDGNFSSREAVFRAFARFTLELHNDNIFHNDYSPGNILIKQEGEDYIFKIVDINRMKFFALSEDDRAKNFSKLWADDEILVLMADEYKKHCVCSENFTKQVLYYSNKNKKIKNLKKRLKGQEVND